MSADSGQITLGRLRISRPAAVAAALTLLFIGFSIWWLLYDRRVPGGGDPGRHLAITLAYGQRLGDGDFGAMLDLPANWGEGFFYPPLVHLIGSVPAALGLAAQDWSTIAINLVFVPLLATGCFLIGRMTYGPTAGVLAVAFALGTPMVLSLFHVFLLDAPLAATVAIALWALLASDRFGRTREAALAGALLGLATLVKTPAPLFLAGPIAVMLIGGGWRQWRNLVLFGAMALIVAAPYYLIHWELLIGTSEATTIAGNTGDPGPGLDADSRFSLDHLAYYGWAAINLQYLVPLLALFAVGLVVAMRELRRRRHLPELIAGLVVGYLGPTLVLSVRDPRYTLPLIVYVAAIATGWIAVTRRPMVAGLAAAVLAGAVVFNVAGATVDEVPTVRVTPPWDEQDPLDLTDAGRFTLTDARGYVVGPPRSGPLWDRLLSEAKREGLETAQIFPRETPLFGTDMLGFDVLASQYGIQGASFAELPRRPDLRINTWWTNDSYYVELEGLPVPCGTVEEGSFPPPASEPVTLSVAVERRVGNGYQRWCDF